MTERCEIKRGFFVMQSCPNPGASKCENCGKLACQPHLSAKSSMKYCVGCAGKIGQDEIFSSQRKDSDTVGDYYYNDYWIYSYRNQYYNQGYSPFMYSETDYSSFDQYADDADFYEEDDYAGDFYDS
jgi:hypothetical protein